MRRVRWLRGVEREDVILVIFSGDNTGGERRE